MPNRPTQQEALSGVREAHRRSVTEGVGCYPSNLRPGVWGGSAPASGCLNREGGDRITNEAYQHPNRGFFFWVGYLAFPENPWLGAALGWWASYNHAQQRTFVGLIPHLTPEQKAARRELMTQAYLWAYEGTGYDSPEYARALIHTYLNTPGGLLQHAGTLEGGLPWLSVYPVTPALAGTSLAEMAGPFAVRHRARLLREAMRRVTTDVRRAWLRAYRAELRRNPNARWVGFETHEREYRPVAIVLNNGGTSMPTSCSFCRRRACQCPSVPRCRMASPLAFHGEIDTAIPRYVGLELEVCGIHDTARGRAITAAVQAWGGCVKEDGSLPGGGFEIALAPARGRKAFKQIAEVCKALIDARAWTDHRAGGHVHVDARGMTWQSLSALFTLWYLLESHIFETVARGRDSSNYCRPWNPRRRSDVNPLQALSDAVVFNPRWLFHSLSGEDGRRDLNAWGDRYTAVNLCNIRYDESTGKVVGGTVEFRLFPGTVSPSIATRNAILASRIVHCANKWPVGKLATAWQENDPAKLLDRILGKRGRELHTFCQTTATPARRAA